MAITMSWPYSTLTSRIRTLSVGRNWSNWRISRAVADDRQLLDDHEHAEGRHDLGGDGRARQQRGEALEDEPDQGPDHEDADDERRSATGTSLRSRSS